MSKFDIGDKVVVVAEHEDLDHGSGDGMHFQIGCTGTIVFSSETAEMNNDNEWPADPVVRVAFDDGCHMWAHESELALCVDTLFSEVSDA